MERRLGPVVGLGTWNTFGADADQARDVVAAALDTGVRLFDSSPMYRGAEGALAAALAGRRDGVTIATKIWAASVDEGREQYRRQVERFGRVEIEQIHNLLAWQSRVSDRRARGPHRPHRRHPLLCRRVRARGALRTGRFDAPGVATRTSATSSASCCRRRQPVPIGRWPLGG